MPLDDQSELFYLVDDNDNVLGSVTRKEAHLAKKNHRSICILVKNSKNQLIFQKRSAKKDRHPLKWTLSVSGHVTYLATYLEAAKRELAEELGISLELTFIKKVFLKNSKEFCHVYSALTDQTPTNFDKDEISEIKWVDIKKIEAFIKNNELTPAAKQILMDEEIVI